MTKRTTNYTHITLIVFAILLVGGLLYLKGANKLNKMSQNQIPLPTPIPYPTAEWKQYSDQKNKFSFKHPSNWLTSTPATIFSTGDVLTIGLKNCCGVTFAKPIKTDLSLEKHVESNKDIASKDTRQNSTIKLDGENALISAPLDCKSHCRTYVFAKHSGFIYGIVSVAADASCFLDLTDTFQALLSTFKFQ